MNPDDLLAFFIQIAPEFSDYWKSDQNYCLYEDGTFTLHGVCSEFSHYFVDQSSWIRPSLVLRPVYPDISTSNMKKLFGFIEENVYEGENHEGLDENLDNALTTCFLENIAKTKAGDYARNFMGKKSRKYYDCWNM